MPEEKKEMTMETRLLLAFLLMGLVLFGTQYFYKPAPATQTAANKPGPAKQAEVAKEAQQPAAPAAPPSPGTAQAAEIPGQVHADKEETFTVDTDLFHVEFSNRGAVVKSWILKKFKDHKDKPLDLVNTAALAEVPAPFSIYFKNQQPANDPNAALFKVDSSDDNLSLNFEYSDGRSAVRKTFKFAKDSYRVNVTTQVTDNGIPVPHSIEWRGGFGDETVVNAPAEQKAVYYDLTNSKLLEKDPKEAKNGPVTFSGQFSFAGLEDKYFAGVFLPTNKSSVDITVFSDAIPAPTGTDKQQRVGAAVGGEGVNTFSYFIGPKDNDLLKKVDPKLTQLIDWGWFEILAKPLFLALNWTADNLVHNWGWAIILVTVVINLILFPLRFTSLKSSRKMQRLQPQIAAINAKYKSIPLRDPRKADQNQELMDLYKREGVNPMGGCVPMLIQLPFLYAFYKVLSISIEMRGAPWLWVHDLSQPETLAIRVLPVVLVITQFLTQKMTPQPGVDPSQQKMMMIMPVFLGYVFYFLSSGLVLYYLTGNLVGILQQWLMNRASPPAPAAPVAAEKPKKKR
jgi:YidC/Oxa1 family membrane protein insertase